MIKKLRRKFIFINMILVSLVLLIVFATIGAFSYQMVKRDTLEAMERAAQRSAEMRPPDFTLGEKRTKKPAPLIPTFTVTLNADQSIKSVISENAAASEAVIEAVTAQVLNDGNRSGALLDLQLRYIVRETPEGTKVVFADMGRELSALSDLLLTLFKVGLGGEAAFFVISLFLSGWALKPVEQAWEQQRQFVADASHELKTPLTVILANTGILLAHKEDTIDSQIKWVAHTQAEANRMKKLVDDLLFLAKADASELSQKPLPFNLSDALWRSVLPFEPVAFEQGVEIDSEVEADIEVTGDESQLKQLILILLDNACKYAGRGGRVTVSLSRQGESVQLRVHNTGGFIPEDQQERIFERFFRTDSSRVREEGGYGLGLSIAKAILDAHNGSIAVSSSPQQGTAFTVTLPLK